MRKKSKYRPRAVLADPVSWVMNGLKPLRDVQSEHVKLRAKMHAAMDELVHGKGDRGHIEVLIHALNMAEALAQVATRLGQDWQDEIRAGQDSLLSMSRRGLDRGGRFIFTGAEMAAVNLAIEVHDEQLSQCSVSQLEKGVEIVRSNHLHKKVRYINPKKLELA